MFDVCWINHIIFFTSKHTFAKAFSWGAGRVISFANQSRSNFCRCWAHPVRVNHVLRMNRLLSAFTIACQLVSSQSFFALEMPEINSVPAVKKIKYLPVFVTTAVNRVTKAKPQKQSIKVVPVNSSRPQCCKTKIRHVDRLLFCFQAFWPLKKSLFRFESSRARRQDSCWSEFYGRL